MYIKKPMSEVGLRLSDFIKSRMLTQRELADMVGWSDIKMARICDGERALEVNDVIVIARKFDIDPNLFLSYLVGTKPLDALPMPEPEKDNIIASLTWHNIEYNQPATSGFYLVVVAPVLSGGDKLVVRALWDCTKRFYIEADVHNKIKVKDVLWWAEMPEPPKI